MIVSVQYLRAVAALMVVFYHLVPQLERMGWHATGLDWLSSGVDIFFVISGFIMWTTTSGGTTSPLAFYEKRLIRIVPLYWILTTFTLVLLLTMPRLLQSSALRWDHVIASYLFVPALHPVKPTMEPLVMPGWTLNYEMFFYMVFGLALLLPQKIRVSAVATIFILLVGLGRWVENRQSVTGFYTSSIILEFLFGMLVGRLHESRRSLAARWAWPAILIGVGFIAAAGSLKSTELRAFLWGLPATLLMLGVLALDRNRRVIDLRWARLLGDASYSIYLVHGIILSAVSQGWRAIGLATVSGGLVGFAVTAASCAAIGGVLLFLLVEQPALRWCRSLRLNPAGPGDGSRTLVLRQNDNS